MSDKMLETFRAGRIADLGMAVLSMPQIDMELSHVFTDNAYCRKLIMPANTVVMGAIHKKAHILVCCYGLAEVVNDDGVKETFTAGQVWTTKVGSQRAIHVIEESCWVGFIVGKYDGVDDAEEQIYDMPDYLDTYYKRKASS